jgi:translation initiation factor IF-2
LGAAPAPAAPEPTRPGGSAAPEVPGLTAVPEDRSAEASPRRANVATASGDTVAPRPGPVAREEAPAPLGGAPNAALPESRPADAGPRPAAQDDRPAGAPPRRADVPPAAEAPTASREAAAPTPEPRGPREGEAQRISSQPPPSPSPAEPRPATARPAAGPAGGPPRPEAPGAGPARPRPDFSPARILGTAPGFGDRRPAGPGYGDRRPTGPGGGFGDRRPGGPGFPDRRPAGPGGGFGDRRPGGPGGPGFGDRRPGGPGLGDRRPGGPGFGDRRPGGPGGFGPRPGGPGGPRPGGFGPRPGGFGPRPGGGFGPRPGGGPGGRPGFGAPAPAPGADRARRRGPQNRERDAQRRQEAEDRERELMKLGRMMRRPESRPDTARSAAKRVIRIEDVISVGNLAQTMGVKAADVLRKLIELGVVVTINQTIDYDTAVLVASEFGYEVQNVAMELEQVAERVEEKPEDLVPRPPVVTIMGHVDHGKTSLLDAIRQTDVAAGEAGGITQHIGAYDVALPDGRRVAFLDTPGHEAFTAMRARGAKVTDLVVLVVAADDGVMPQTVEAINHAKAADVPIVVAVNKVDKPEAQPERIRQALTEHGLVAEEWGGETQFVNVSAKTKQGIPELLESILVQAEVLDLRANPKRPAEGTIVEAKLDKGRGPVATALIETGTLRPGDAFVVGQEYGRVRAMYDDRGNKVDEAGPSKPVEVLGLSGVPEAGDRFTVVADDRRAREVAEARAQKAREAELAKTTKVSLEDLYSRIQQGDIKELSLIIKADVQGSVEALSEALKKQSTEAVRVSVLHGSVGGVTESDVNLASASKAIIIAFNIRPEPKAAALAEQQGIDIRVYSVIYDAVNDVRAAMEGLLAPTLKENVIGRAEVRNLFSVPKVGTVAGCFVQDGTIRRGAKVRLLRDNVPVWEGNLASLRRFKDDVREVQAGYECGIGLEGFNDLKVGDVIEAYVVEEVATTLEEASAQAAAAQRERAAAMPAPPRRPEAPGGRPGATR